LNRDDRKHVFDSYWKTFHDFQGTMGSTLTAQVLGEVFEARVRHFPNSLAAATFTDNMPETVYRTLVAQANKGLPVLHRYLTQGKKALGV
jgi:oligoendopeptidase F